MSNPILQSESFDRSAFTLARSLDNFGTGDFEQSVQTFKRSVDKLAIILGMQAENDQRKANGESMAYGESDFASVL